MAYNMTPEQREQLVNELGVDGKGQEIANSHGDNTNRDNKDNEQARRNMSGW